MKYIFYLYLLPFIELLILRFFKQNNKMHKITSDDYFIFSNGCTNNINGVVKVEKLNGSDSTTFWLNSYSDDIESEIMENVLGIN